MKPVAPERRGRRLFVLEVTLHHVVAAHDDLAHRLAVRRYVVHLRVDHAKPLGVDHPDTLAGQQRRPLLDLEILPALLPLTHRVRAVGLGQPIDVQDPRIEALALRDRGRARRRARGGHHQGSLQRVRLLRAGQGREHRGGAVEVRDLLLLEELPDAVASHRAQAHVAAADGGHGPSRAPAVAMEHRERPQVDRVGAVLGVQDLPEAVQVGAPVGVDDALGLPGGPRRVVDRDRGQLVLDHPAQRLVGSTLEQVGIAGAGRLGVVHLGHRVGDRDDLPDRLELVLQRGDDRAQLRVDYQQLGPGMVTDVAHLLSRQSAC